MGRAKTSVIIPIEGQARELDAKLLLAAVAAERGYRAILGSRNHIHLVLDQYARCRSIDARQYPRDIELDERLYEDARLMSQTRMLALALYALADARGGRLPTRFDALGHRALRDATTGRPFSWSMSAGAGSLRSRRSRPPRFTTAACQYSSRPPPPPIAILRVRPPEPRPPPSASADR